jgi:hypothetical protein
MVDYGPVQGDYINSVVQNNVILGGFSTDQPEPGEKEVIIEYVGRHALKRQASFAELVSFSGSALQLGLILD